MSSNSGSHRILHVLGLVIALVLLGHHLCDGLGGSAHKMGAKSAPDRRLAYSFLSDLTLREMRDVLDRKSSLKWSGGDSEYCGVYLHSETLRDGLTSIRILSADKRFAVNMDYLFGVPDSMPYEEVRAIVDKEIFPLLGARDIQPTERCE